MRAVSGLLGIRAAWGLEGQLLLHFTRFNVRSDSSKLTNCSLGGALTVVPHDVTPHCRAAVKDRAL